MRRMFLNIIVVTVLLASCDNREDVFAKINEDPVIIMKKNGNEMVVFRDTVKIGYPLVLGYQIIDEEELVLNTEESEGVSVVVGEEIGYIEINGFEEGEKEVVLYCVDSFLREASKEVEIYSFLNMNPVASLTLTKILGFEVDIDGRNSYDPDERFGGGLDLYEYKIQGITYQSDKDRINFVYGSAGTKTVMLRARDNNGIWSSWVTEYIVL